MDYELLEAQADALLSEERDDLANLSNFAAFVFNELPDVNWAGFYFADQTGELVLGPFNGQPACTRLPYGRGVCGSAYKDGQTVVVEDVHAFSDHIVCDTASASEIVVPLRDAGGVYGVFDIDSPLRGRFVERDRDGIERLVSALLRRVRARPAFLERRGR